MNISRRAALAAASAAAVLGCAGVAPPAAKTPPPSGPLGGETQVFPPVHAGGDRGLVFAEAPEWLRRSPALWVPTAESAGAGVIMLSDDDRYTLVSRMDHFDQLPELLDTAESLGTSVVYLVDWYDPGDLPAAQAWRNKGDYTPRADMGGEAAFRAGIAAIRKRGGRIVLYVEGFIISQRSAIGVAKGEKWSLRGPGGAAPEEPYPGNWKCCPLAGGFAAHLESVARRLGSYGASGIFLDSYGFQKDWVCTAKNHDHPPGDPDAFNRGAVALVRRMAAALREGTPDAILLCEGPKLPELLAELHGTFDWGIHRLVEKPGWSLAGRTDTWTMGYSLDDLHQLLAMGAKLALGQPFVEKPRGASAAARIAWRRAKRRMPGSTDQRHHYLAQMFFETHQWRNSAILAGIAVPGLDDVAPRRGQHEKLFQSEDAATALLERLAARAAELDAAIGSRAGELAAPNAHIARICRGRTAISPWVDDGAEVAFVETGSSDVPAWRFSSRRGVAFTAANVSNRAISVRLPLSGRYRDVLGGDDVDGPTSVPPHGLRLLTPA